MMLNRCLFYLKFGGVDESRFDVFFYFLVCACVCCGSYRQKAVN